MADDSRHAAEQRVRRKLIWHELGDGQLRIVVTKKFQRIFVGYSTWAALTFSGIVSVIVTFAVFNRQPNGTGFEGLIAVAGLLAVAFLRIALRVIEQVEYVAGSTGITKVTSLGGIAFRRHFPSGQLLIAPLPSAGYTLSLCNPDKLLMCQLILFSSSVPDDCQFLGELLARHTGSPLRYTESDFVFGGAGGF